MPPTRPAYVSAFLSGFPVRLCHCCAAKWDAFGKQYEYPCRPEWPHFPRPRHVADTIEPCLPRPLSNDQKTVNLQTPPCDNAAGKVTLLLLLGPGRPKIRAFAALRCRRRSDKAAMLLIKGVDLTGLLGGHKRRLGSGTPAGSRGRAPVACRGSGGRSPPEA